MVVDNPNRLKNLNFYTLLQSTLYEGGNPQTL